MGTVSQLPCVSAGIWEASLYGGKGLGYGIMSRMSIRAHFFRTQVVIPLGIIQIVYLLSVHGRFGGPAVKDSQPGWMSPQ